MSKGTNDIDLLGLDDDITSVKTQPDSFLNESIHPIVSGSGKLEKPFDGGNTLDEPVITTIVSRRLLDARPTNDPD